MASCFEESRLAYVTGDRALAKELSIEGKEHKERMEQLNAEASAWIFASMLRCPPNDPRQPDKPLLSLVFREQ